MLTLITSTGKRFTGTVKELKALAVQPATLTCSACSLTVINGFPCHELGCPEAWRDETRECGECGTKFVPAERLQAFCSDDCQRSHFGYFPDHRDDDAGDLP